MATRNAGRGKADFSQKTRDLFCFRVGTKCSNPKCKKRLLVLNMADLTLAFFSTARQRTSRLLRLADHIR